MADTGAAKDSGLSHHYIERVVLKGVWGYRSFDISFKPSENFLIGQNGSGKTTIINFLACVVGARFSDIASIPFKSAEITFASQFSKYRPKIAIRRKLRTGSKFADALVIKVDFIDPSGNEVRLRETLANTRVRRRVRRGVGVYVIQSEGRELEPPSSDLSDSVKDLCAVTWLSVHRDADGDSDISEEFESSVDERIAHINSRFFKYFTAIEFEKSKETREFEKRLFRSMMTVAEQKVKFSDLKAMDLNSQKAAIRSVFDNLKIENSAEIIEQHYRTVTSVRDKLSHNQDIKLDDILGLASLFQAEATVVYWQDYQAKIAEHEIGKEKLKRILGEYFSSKPPMITSDGKIVFAIKNHQKGDSSSELLPPFDLSSGEKQIFIFLLEALLEENRKIVYIADEPELSLHVKWQETLVSSLHALNPNAQLILATHSPDIVSSFTDSVIDLTPSENENVT